MTVTAARLGAAGDQVIRVVVFRVARRVLTGRLRHTSDPLRGRLTRHEVNLIVGGAAAQFARLAVACRTSRRPAVGCACGWRHGRSRSTVRCRPAVSPPPTRAPRRAGGSPRSAATEPRWTSPTARSRPSCSARTRPACVRLPGADRTAPSLSGGARSCAAPEHSRPAQRPATSAITSAPLPGIRRHSHDSTTPARPAAPPRLTSAETACRLGRAWTQRSPR